MSNLRVDNITDELGTGAPEFTNGLTSNGNVLVGNTVSRGSRFEVERTDNDNAIADFKTNNAAGDVIIRSSGGLVRVRAQGTNDMALMTSGTVRMLIAETGTVFFCGSTTSGVFDGDGVNIDATGEVSINTLTGSPLDLNQSTADTVSRSMIRFFRNETQRGSITSSSTATAYVTTSDYRLKENVQLMTGALGVVAKLKPVTYTWKTDGSDGQGFIAHELQEVVPDCVIGKKDAVDADGKPEYQGVDTSFLVATLVKAIQELTARIEALETTQ